MLSLTGAPSCPTSRKAATIWGVIFSCYWSKGAFSLMPVFGLASASLWIDIPCSPGYSLPHWPLLLQFMASKFMVHSFGLDFVPKRNWPLPPANSSFSQFLLASNPWFTLQLPSSTLAWWPFLSPCCEVTSLWLSLMLVSKSMPSTHWSEYLPSPLSSSLSPS